MINIPCPRTFIPDYSVALAPDSCSTLLYFHGGGFVYGDKEDLPLEAINIFLENQITLVKFNYPLIPESSFSDLLKWCERSVEWFILHYAELGLSSPNFILFGRSAGGYIISYLYARKRWVLCEGLINFYGFYDLKDHNLHSMTLFQNLIAPISKSTAGKFLKEQSYFSLPITKRYLLYAYLRQNMLWPSADEELKEIYSLKPAQFTSFPRQFLAVSLYDPEIPSQQLLALRSETTYFFQDFSTKHDFDQDFLYNNARKVYQELINWIIQGG